MDSKENSRENMRGGRNNVPACRDPNYSFRHLQLAQ